MATIELTIEHDRPERCKSPGRHPQYHNSKSKEDLLYNLVRLPELESIYKTLLYLGHVLGVLIVLTTIHGKGEAAQEPAFLRVEHLVGTKESPGGSGHSDQEILEQEVIVGDQVFCDHLPLVKG